MTDPKILQRAKQWLTADYDDETRAAVQALIDADDTELTDAFYRDLEFGTGGLRGIMGPGTNRMNKYTVGKATQGLANYLRKAFANEPVIKVVIGYDCRINNTFFAEVTSSVLSANGIEVYLFDALRPTPEVSFAIRHLQCHSGIMITASHNPKEYNGYKVYWSDGAQIIAPDDKNIINEVLSIQEVTEINFQKKPSLIKHIGEEIDTAYIEKIASYSLSPHTIAAHNDLKIVYTPIHGTGVKLVPMALERFGFQEVTTVEAQNITDGSFPTVASPNPEEAAALAMAITKAKEIDAALVMGTDPDSDRVGIAIKNSRGGYTLLNGNQTATLLFYYILKQKEKQLKGNEFIVKTIVTTELLKEIAQQFGVESYDVLTGFKYIAAIIREQEGKKRFLVGGEESYGYLVGDYVRDKDAVISCAMIAETAAWAHAMGKTMEELLTDIYVEFGLYKESLLSVVRQGKKGAEEIAGWMDKYRNAPFKELNNTPVVTVLDYLNSVKINQQTGKKEAINLPPSNVMQFILADETKITARPSGTEPKIKYYFSVKTPLEKPEEYPEKEQELTRKLEALTEIFK
ncbi:MAG: phosphoglucomutase [Bacteroidetes bacterium]|nr:MAG: phosphoglucomutase [Bacteroidota bacterium]PIE88270.1 MAG: phosphoglucomutase [Bacteroidota bacterium]